VNDVIGPCRAVSVRSSRPPGVLPKSILKTRYHLYSNSFMKFLKDPSLDPSSLYLTHHSAHSPSTVISNSAANHHLYADDTQLLLSFSALHFSHNITHLVNTIANVSNLMSSNVLSLNPSKTEFLIFGLPQQLSKLKDPTIHLPNNIILSPAVLFHRVLHRNAPEYLRPLI